MAPVARELAVEWGILEPLQTAKSVEGQVGELRAHLATCGAPPVTLIGFSWGAWLSFIVAARYPALVSKLVLVGSGGFEEEYAAGLLDLRLCRLDEEERKEAETLLELLEGAVVSDRSGAFARLGALLSKADAYDPIAYRSEVIDHQVDLFQSVWREAAELRRSGKLLALGKQIRCPVIAIHGDYDPHPAEGVQQPLSATLTNFRFVLLKRCGHMPWIERQARAEFYRVLKEELRSHV